MIIGSAISVFKERGRDPVPTAASGLEKYVRVGLGVESGVFTLEAEARSADAGPLSLGLQWSVEGWHEDVYVLMPGAMYAGNRFESHKIPYSPRYPADRIGPDMPVIISDVPRLERDMDRASRVQLLAGDMAWPAVAGWDPRDRRAFLITAPSHTDWGQTLWELEEPAGHGACVIRLMAPGIRDRRYVHMRTDNPTDGSGYVPHPGDRLELEARVETWSCDNLGEFYARIFARWHEALDPASVPPSLSFSQTFDIIAAKFERENWKEGWGLYLVDPNPESRYPYQTGWCGGGISAFALLDSPDTTIRSHAAENIDRIAGEALTDCGLVYGKRAASGWISDFHGQEQNPHTLRWTLTRRQGDALFYLAKSILRTEAADQAALPKSHPWKQALRRLADALASTFARDGQWGHFLDQFTGRVAVGGTSSGAIIPAGLVLAGKLLAEESWLACAEAAARDFLSRWTRHGVTTGGPADALGCPDSESAAALVESYTLLWQATGKAEWLHAAVAAAHQMATWVMPYAYPFPQDTEFGRLNMDTTGTVFANVQNKHSAPGICTHSGQALLRIFRATGDRRILDLLTAIARTLPQYVSRSDRPIHDLHGRPLPEGWINERVNTSDWDNNLGGVFYGSCWCEASALLTWAELPGVYWQPDTGVLAVLDHVEAQLQEGRLIIRNILAKEVRIRLKVETSAQAAMPDPIEGNSGALLTLSPGESLTVNSGVGPA